MIKMIKTGFDNIILLLLFFGLLFSIDVVVKEITIESICPKIGGFPACYLVVVYFLALLIIHIFTKNTITFLALTGFALALSGIVVFSYFSGKIYCPIHYLGIPLCVIIFGIFIFIICCKFIQVKHYNR